MASHSNKQARLVRVSGREPWYIQYYEGERPKRLSTKTSDKAKAQAALEDFVQAQRSTGGVTDPTVERVLALYIEDRVKLGKIPEALEARAKRLVTYFRDTLASHVTREKGRLFAQRQQDRDYSSKTVGDDLSLLRSALRFAKEEGWIETVPTINIPKPPDPKDRWLSDCEATKLLQAATAFHLRLFILLALTTGARAGAILELRWEQVNFSTRTINFNPPGRKQTAKTRPTVPINEALLNALEYAQKRAVSDFVVEWAGRKVARISKGFREVVRRAGLEGVTPHTLRHTAATWMAQRDVPLDRVAAMLGHRKVETTYRVYIKHTPQYLSRAADALDLRSDLWLNPRYSPGKGQQKKVAKRIRRKLKRPKHKHMERVTAR